MREDFHRPRPERERRLTARPWSRACRAPSGRHAHCLEARPPRALTFHLVQTIAGLGERGVNFRSLSDPIDTQSAGGRLVLHIMAAIAEFERALVVERTKAGLDAARRRGKKLGRRRLLTATHVTLARRLLGAGETRAAVAHRLGVSLSTLCLAISRDKTGR